MRKRICRLIYSSSPNLVFGSAEKIADEIMPSAVFNNIRNNITGLLISDDCFFLQILEGDRQAVSDAFLKIALDYRHGVINLISVSDVNERLFPSWSMTATTPSETRTLMLQRYSSITGFDHCSLTAAAAIRLVMDAARLFKAKDLNPEHSVVYVE
jgi:hypothetical protein